MSVLSDALARLLETVPRPPATVEEAVAVFGGRKAALARAIEGIPAGARLPQKGTAERRRYEASLRRIERYTASEGRQRRGQTRPDPDFLRRALGEARRAAGPSTPANIARARRAGLHMVWRAELRVSSRWTTNTMPAPVGGVEVPLHVPGELLGDVADDWEADEREAAGDGLADAFLIAYELPGADWRNPQWCRLRW